jgi:hypothetical protein
LIVNGGAGIGGNLFAGNIYSNNLFYANGLSWSSAAASSTSSSAISLVASANSVQFNGSNYLNAASLNAYMVENSQFTIEAWVNPTSITGQQTIVSNWQSTGTGANRGWNLFIISGNISLLASRSGVSGTGTTILTSTGKVSAGVWSHVAVTRNSVGLIQIFINGVASGSTTYSTTLDNGFNVFLLSGTRVATSWVDGAISSPFIGYISNLRIVVDNAIYTSAFTPPTSALSASVTPGTVKLLACHATSATVEGTNTWTITATGSPVVSISAGPYFSGFEYKNGAFTTTSNIAASYFLGNLVGNVYTNNLFYTNGAPFSTGISSWDDLLVTY